MKYEISFLYALLFTIIIETSVIWILCKTTYKTINLSNISILLSGFILSFATLPYVWFVFPYFIHQRFLYISVSEMFAFVTEAILLWSIFKVPIKHSFVLSFCANICSYIIGLLLVF
ncbi:MAG TPA: hypothetical protein P5243_01655 [Bacteroidales bacterium]|nr:hypothetical protein [Bacteroidales bacterium]HRS18181.1 hypothetical protein [Bacteroidales bacterium]